MKPLGGMVLCPFMNISVKLVAHVTEELQKFSDPPLDSCPDCGGRVSKLMSMNTFHLKGSGWYVTDYAHKNSTSPSPSKSEAN